VLTGNLDEKDEKVTWLYPELACEGRPFQTQLDMFPGMTTTEKAPTLNACCYVLINMVPAMRAMFPHVEALIRLLVNPASSATAERSFSSLRRLKT